MKNEYEMGSSVMIYKPSFIQIGSAIQKLIGGGDKQHGDCISLFLIKKQ
jgi:hypothetical protein